MKVLDTKYHTQVNNEILPFVTCGTTSLANYLNWINIHWNKAYVCDDDKVMQTMNGPEMLARAKSMIVKGIIDQSALEYRQDNPQTPAIDESKFTHLNNFMEVIAECGKFLTNNEFDFKIEYQTPDNIKTCIDNDFPALTSARFTTGGHFVLIAGYDDEKNFIVDDPYGDWNSNYSQGTVGNGAKLKYSIDKMSGIYTFKKGDAWRILRAYQK